MSKARIEQYYTEVEEAIQLGGNQKESSIRRYFANLVEYYAHPKHLNLIDEKAYRNLQNKTKYPDGTLQYKNSEAGHWESKDVDDNLEQEIIKKFEIGYPQYNILFENSQTAILYQAPNRLSKGTRVQKANMKNWKELHDILTNFINYETEEIHNFREALEEFKKVVPSISKLLRFTIQISAGEKVIDDFDTATQLNLHSVGENQRFIDARKAFLDNCKLVIHQNISLQEVDEMIIQHILTENIFNIIFGQVQFHQENNISNELSQVIKAFFHSEIRQNTTDNLVKIYSAFEAEAAYMKIYQEKQKFLKIIYEEFYKAYNEKGADRLGIVYTPNEIVHFMLQSSQKILHEHFRKTFANEEVEILDPATGTGTFICDLIEMLPKKDLERKFENEIHCNEISILAYYIANLNIEYTYKEKMGTYKPFRNICFVDTLDILMHAGNRSYNVQQNLYGVSMENLERIKKQTRAKISIIIGNPPYNANQQNENENNKNRVYLRKIGDNKKDVIGVDKRIAETYIAESSAQKTKQYDMYKRFIRWSSDRINENGMISFVLNRSFIDKRQDDGFRKSIQKEFDFAYIIDLGGDLRTDGAEASDNVFGIQIGVAILFLVKKQAKKVTKERICRIFYHRVESFKSKKEKLQFLAMLDWEDIDFEEIAPDERGNWINLTDNDFESLLPLCSKQVKLGREQEAIFKLFSNGVSTNRDEWVYDFSKKNLTKKMKFFMKEYNSEVSRWAEFKKENKYEDIKEESNPVIDTFVHDRNLIKWSKMIKRDKLRKGKRGKFDKNDIIKALYRPFCSRFLYYGYIPIDLKGEFPKIFPNKTDDNKLIFFTNSTRGKFSNLASNCITDLNVYVNSPIVCLPFHRYENGKKIENITDWALEQFRNNYELETENDKLEKSIIQKMDIFHYIYAVLHYPAYRQKYEQNLKRDFPRIPFYDDFWKWASWGKALMNLHLEYETASSYQLVVNSEQVLEGKREKVILKADQEKGQIVLTDCCSLCNVPTEAWEYKLGSRSALEWILDQYKESKPTDATVAEQFDDYRFADYKDSVIELLKKVCTISIETMKILKAMKN
jgi:predicted helicase